MVILKGFFYWGVNMSDEQSVFKYQQQDAIEVFVNVKGTIAIVAKGDFSEDDDQIIALNDDAARFVISSLRKCLVEKRR